MDKSVQLKYQFRKYLKAFYDDLIKQKQADPKSVKLELGKLQRFRNIVNQTDPEELFAPFKDEELEGFISGKKKFSSKSPDRRVFERVRVVMEGDLHHAMEIDRNIDAVPDEWDVDADDARLRKYHGTLKQAKMQIGSAAANLPEFRKIDHDPQGADNTPENRARSAHPDGTKSTRFKYEETDPVKRAAETIMYNESSDYRIREIENDPERLSNKVFEQSNVDDIEQGGQGFQRRTLRKTTVTPFRNQTDLNKYGSDRLQEMVLPPGLRRAAKLLGKVADIPGVGGVAAAGAAIATGASAGDALAAGIDAENPIDAGPVAAADMNYMDRVQQFYDEKRGRISSRIDRLRKRGRTLQAQQAEDELSKVPSGAINTP